MRVADLAGAVVVLLFGCAIAFFASRLPYEAEYGPGPGFVPLWIGIALAACGAWLTIRNITRRVRSEGTFVQPKTGQVLFIFVTLLVTFVLFPLLGLASSLGLFTGFTMRATGRHRWALVAFVTVITTVAVRIIFGHFLDIPLPKGYLGI